MRILHSADWRLGRAFHGRDLLAEQAALLERVVAEAEERRAEALLLAGGLLDAAAGPQARAVLDHALGRLALDAGVRVVLLADEPSPPLGAGVLARCGVHVVPRDAEPGRAIRLEDADGPVDVHAVAAPADWAELAAALGRASGGRDASSRGIVLVRAPAGEPPDEPLDWSAFALAVVGGALSPLDGASPAAVLGPAGFDDAEPSGALGLVDLDGAGRTRSESIPLTGVPDLRVEAGTAQDLLALPADGRLTRLLVSDPGLAPELKALRERFPALLEVERPEPGTRAPRLDVTFAAWCAEVDGEPPDASERAILRELAGGQRR
jgi:exonuclease SbcD